MQVIRGDDSSVFTNAHAGGSEFIKAKRPSVKLRYFSPSKKEKTKAISALSTAPTVNQTPYSQKPKMKLILSEGLRQIS